MPTGPYLTRYPRRRPRLSGRCAVGLALLLLASCSDPSVAPCTDCEPPAPLYTSANLAGHEVFAECNPGNQSQCACDTSDVALRSRNGHGEVTSNANRRGTYVNAIGARKFTDTFPDGTPLTLGRYSYTGEVRLPVLPRPDATQRENPQAVHMMVQLYDGRDALFAAEKTTLEGAIYWDLNPWLPDVGTIRVYTGEDPLSLVDTGLTVPPDTAWHTFSLTVDLATRRYVAITVDGQIRDLSHLPLARVAHPEWGDDLSLILTTESMAAWPQATCGQVFTWTTHFRNLVFTRAD
ncbi:MAG: hypothetical protein KatS3mg042_0788 [Rhodothermaceae bacterium]|nr:MAG: hypothetical protein KatS3mg042_0788 [Rhodothermaceae bacterium]